jgi:hypothetical protein
MRVGALTEVHIEDVTLWMLLDWGQLKKAVKAVTRLEGNDLEPVEDIIREHVLPRVRKVEGLEAEDGTPVTELTEETLDALPPRFLKALLGALLNVGGEADAGSPPA